MKASIVVAFILATFSLVGQKEDHIWLFSHGIGDQVDPELKSDTTYGATYISFLTDPPKVKYDSTRVWDFNGTNSCLSSFDGELQIYTNGQVIYDGDHQIIEDTINYNHQWDNWSLIYQGVLVNTGLPTIQGALILPLPENENLVYIFYSSYDIIISRTTQMSYSIVDLQQKSILVRDVPILTDTLLSSGNFNAVQHANGRDHAEIYKYLLTPNGIERSDLQQIGDSYDSVRGQLFFFTGWV